MERMIATFTMSTPTTAATTNNLFILKRGGYTVRETYPWNAIHRTEETTKRKRLMGNSTLIQGHWHKVTAQK